MPDRPGLWAKYFSDEEKLELLTGPVYIKAKADLIEPAKERGSVLFNGELDRKEDYWHVKAFPEWNPDNQTGGIEALHVKNLKEIHLSMLPDSQPNKPLSLFWDGELVSQGQQIDFTLPTVQSQQEKQTQNVQQTNNNVGGWIEQNKSSIIIGGGVLAAASIGAGWALTRGGKD